MTKDEIRRMSNEDLVGRFVAYVGADYQTDYAPYVHPLFSEDTRELWGEIEQRMSGVVTVGFDRKFFEATMRDEMEKQAEIIKCGPDYSTSYHVGIRSGLNDALRIVQGSLKAEQEEGGGIECDQCHEVQSAFISDSFCPNCGADMRGGDAE